MELSSSLTCSQKPLSLYAYQLCLEGSEFDSLACALYNLVPRAWKLGVEVMDLRRVNLFTLFLSPVLPYLGPETFLLEDTLVSTCEQLTLLHFV
jgi:hypothetical protein